MKADAIPLGIEIVALEARLDQLFATKTIQNKELIKFVSMIAERKGRSRAVHLSVHLKTNPLLTPPTLAAP